METRTAFLCHEYPSLHVGVKYTRLNTTATFDLHKDAIVTGLRKPVRKLHLR